MAWLKSHQELRGHPKTRRLARALGLSLPDVVGRLHFLWWWAMDYAQDGDLSRYDAADVADAMDWEGDPDVLINALVSCGGEKGAGFLDRAPDGALTIHDWDDHCGTEFEKREKEAQRLREYRAKKKDAPQATEQPTEQAQESTEPVRTTDEPTSYAVRTPYEHGTYVVRGEERRGEEKRGDTTPPTPPRGGAGGEGRREIAGQGQPEPQARAPEHQAREGPTAWEKALERYSKRRGYGALPEVR